jgi:outer membrane protein TolC
MKVFAIILLISGSYFISNAQIAPTSINLSEALSLAQKANQQIKLANIDEQIANAHLKQTEAIWLPQLNFSYTAMSTNNPLNAFGFKLQQASVSSSDFNPTLLNSPGAQSNFQTQLSLQQPIVNMDMAYLRKAAVKQTVAVAMQTKRTTEVVKMQVTQVYLNIDFLYKAQTVAKSALTTVQSIYTLTKNRFDQGLLQKSDLLNVEVQVKSIETQLNDVQSKIAAASDQLSLLMNQPNGIVYKTAWIDIQIPSSLSNTISTNRADFKAIETGLSIYDIAIKGNKMSWLPRLNGFANYQFNDKAALGFTAGNYFAGIQLSWDILKGNQTKNKIATQTIEKNKLQEQYNSKISQDQVELQNTLRQLRDAQFKYAQLQTAVEQAEESLRILQNRYQQGLVNTNDILMAQTQLTQQKFLQAEAKLAQQSAMNYYQFLTTVQ